MGRNFMKAKGGKKPPTGLTPDFGAIFMSNESTKHECLQNNLFGLPTSFNHFVKHVKVGMLLFLFEYENRQLNGVYEATSDGAIDIVPHAYGSSGKKFPAQVQVRTIWHCRPLLEHEFRDAIKDNYYQASKFHFGLSKDQVYHLLRLFHPKRMWTKEARLFSTEHVYQKEHTEELDLQDHNPIGCTRTELDIKKVHPLCNHDELITGYDDPVIDSQLISSSGLGSGPGSGCPIGLEGLSDELHRVTENVDSFIDSVAKDLHVEDFIPMHSSHCTKPSHPATRTSNPDCHQTASLSSRHYGYVDPFQNCGIQRHLVRQEVASSQNDEGHDCIYEASGRGAKVGTVCKRRSVFSRIKFAPKDSRKTDSNYMLPDETSLEIVEQLQKKHGHWSKELNRTNFDGNEKASSLGRRESVFSQSRLTSNPIELDAKPIMKADATIKNLKMNSGQKAKRKVADKINIQVAEGMDGIEVSESISIVSEKVEIRPIDPESSSSTQKQSKRRKLIRPVFGVRPPTKECVTAHTNPDSQFPSEENQVSKGDFGSLAAAAKCECEDNSGFAEESLTLVGEGKSVVVKKPAT